jgi:glutamate/tyrosine decarboxylase-like PLP-dependent enzyme
MSANAMSVPNRAELEEVIALVTRAASAYLQGLDERPTRSALLRDALAPFDERLPERGAGAVAALTQLVEQGIEASIATSGPRSFHFVIGGTTPAALGADWLTTTLDQTAYAWVSSPLATQLELTSLQWLEELFGLGQGWQGVLTTGATMANFVCLAAARQWCGERLGVDIAEQGLGNMHPRVFASGILHPSDVKAVSMLGMGRSAITRCVLNDTGELDVAALERELKELDGAPAILIAVAGEPNAGAFDPIAQMADLAAQYNAWLHVDGAFGLFAALLPSHAHLLKGVERAHSVAGDGHKWLNVPYDCGFGFVRQAGLLAKTFSHSAEYLPDPTDPEPVLGSLGPEMSRRARALTIWATLKAYGREGMAEVVARDVALAQYLSGLVQDLPDVELLAPVPLNVVCFRYNPGGLTEETLNRINRELGAALLEDGRVFVGTTTYRGKVALRPAIVNWRTRRQDVELLAQTARELGDAVTKRL